MTTTVTVRHPGDSPNHLSICRVETQPDGTTIPIGGIVELAPGTEVDLKLTARMYFVVAETPDGDSIASPTGETA
jgi:hypothetical protein